MSLKTRFPIRRFSLFLAALAFIVLACNLTGNDKSPQTFSFNKSYDTLAQFDSVRITLRDTTGRTLDVLYHGHVGTVEDVEKLSANHWSGGIAVLSIVGYMDGETVYRVDRKFNGKNDQILDTLRIILPGTALSAESPDLTLTEGDSIEFPDITVTPLELSDKSLSYTSSAPLVLQVGPTGLKALQRGTAKLTVTLKSNPSKALTLNAAVLPNPLVPDSLFLAPDTLSLAAEGASGSLSVRVSPASADPAVTWSIRDATLGQVVDGSVQGLKAGTTIVVATSKRKPSLSDSVVLIVKAPVPVALVRFQLASLELFVGGAAESLTVDVTPASANPKTQLTARDPAVVTVLGGRVQGLAAGATKVIALSIQNPAAADTLDVTVLPVQHIDSVAVSPDTLRLFTGGPSGALSTKVYPISMSQTVLWRISNPVLVSVDGSGNVAPKSPGLTRAVALSRADSTKKDSAAVLVKRDMPQVSVGRDTVVPMGTTLAFRPKVVQEYGVVAVFRWDLNGDGVADGSSDSVKSVTMTYADAKEVIASFYVKDTEGNDTTVYRKIKAVSGLAVQILEPADSTYTRLFSIAVKWTVDNKEQDSLKAQALVLGKNTILRSAKDEGGNVYPASVTVFVDTTPPNKPLVHGPALSASRTPTWTWGSGGGGGNGTFKYWLDVDDSSKGKLTTDTSFTPATDLTEGSHTLFLAERDKAGNWSGAGRWEIRLDFTLPGTPLVSVTPSASPTNVRKPVWNWSTGENGGSGAYRYKLDNSNLATGAIPATATTFTPAADLPHGSHTLYVQEKDSAGNWSESGFATLFIDTIAPGAPTVSVSPNSPTNETLPTWSWTSGGGGKGYFRWKVGDTVWASGAGQGAQTTFKPETALAEGARTLYVTEQDSAGNWSAAGSMVIMIDLTEPAAPIVTSTSARTTSLKPTWTWTSGGGGGSGYRYKLDNSNLSTGATIVSTATFTPQFNISEGSHKLFVQELDSADNWSNSGSFTVMIYGQTGYAVGGNGTIIRTKNGGLTWTILTGGDDAVLKSVYFFDPSFGVVVGTGGTVMRSSDSGKTWNRSASGIDTTEDLSGVHFPTRNVGYAASNSEKIFKTTDSGTSWSGSVIDPINGSGFYSIFFTDANTGFAAGSFGEGRKSLFKTTNGGSSWTRSGGEFEGIGFAAAITFTSPTTGYLAHDFGQVLRTTDAGNTWDTLEVGSPIEFHNFRAVHFPTSEVGYVVGREGIMFMTPDHGNHWTQVSTQTTEELKGVYFSDAKIGYVTGTNGTIRRTVDGGTTWTPLQSSFVGTSLGVNGVFFP